MTIRTLAFLLPFVATSAYAYAPAEVSDPTVTVGTNGFYVTYGVSQPYDCKVTSFTDADCQYHNYGHDLQLDASGAVLGSVVIPDDDEGTAAGDPQAVLPAGPNGWLLRGSYDAVFVDSNGKFTQASDSLADDSDYSTWVVTSDGWWHVGEDDDYDWQLVHTAFDGSQLAAVPISDLGTGEPVVGVASTGQVLAVWSDSTGFVGQLYDATGNALGNALALGGSDEDYEQSGSIVATSTGFLVHTYGGSSDALVAVRLDGTVTQQALLPLVLETEGSRILTSGPHGGLLFEVSNPDDSEDATSPLTVTEVDPNGALLESPRTVLTVDAARLHIAAGPGGVVVGDTHGTDVRISQLAADGSYINQAVFTNPGPGCSVAGHGNPSTALLLVLCVLALMAVRGRART